MKYKFEKDTFLKKSFSIREEVFGDLQKIVKREDTTFKAVLDGLLSIAVKEYWEERKVKGAIGRPSRRATEPKKGARIRTKAVLKGGQSYCQNSNCPNKGKSYLTRNMIKAGGFVFCTDNCEEEHEKLGM